ncbi:MAG: GntR family transcriptional regulator [Epulopiscium sp.]|nr:GntR family transcriptional regulator [Candidatus Epulonipiscium sp.]
MNLNGEPKYIKVKEFIKKYIADGELKNGDKLFSEHELANKFQISRHTVRKAIGELINEGWLYQIQGKGTFVASTDGMKKKKTKLIGVVTTYLKDYIFPSIIYGIDEILSKEGYTILLGHTNNEFQKERDCLLNMLSNDLEGLIIEPTKSILPNPNLDIYKKFKAKNIPIVFIHAYYNQINSSYVIEDDILGGYLATKHLMDKGHRNIVGIFKSDDMQGHARFQGFVRAHRERDIDINEDAVIWYSSQDRDILFSDYRYFNQSINKEKKYTGIICYNDLIAMEIIKLFKSQGLDVPKDYSIVGFDNSELAQQGEIKLTTVAHPKEVLGRKAASNLISQLKGNQNIMQDRIEPKLMIRNSVKQI